MEEAFAKLASELLEISPYALFVAFAYISAYLMFKVSFNSLQKQTEKTIEEMRKAFDDALKRINDSQK